MAFYVMVQLQFGAQKAYWHPAFEWESKEEADDVVQSLPIRYGEIDRRIIEGKASGDCREHRPC